MTLRVNLGCGDQIAPGWANLDAQPLGQEWLVDARMGLPFPDDSVDYMTAQHSIQQFDHHELAPLFTEVRRVLVPGGVLRLSVPDVFTAFMAFTAGDRDWFPNGEGQHADDGLAVVFSTYVTWYGTNKSAFTFGYLDERIRAGGFETVTPAAFGVSQLCADPGIVALDTRPDESIIVEARK